MSKYFALRTVLVAVLAGTSIGLSANAMAHGGATPTAPQIVEDKLAAQQKKIDALVERCVRFAKQLYGIDDSSIRAPFARFVLIRNADKSALLMITEHTRPQEGKPAWQGPTWHGAKYTLMVQSDGSNDFSKDNVKIFTGEANDEKEESQLIAHEGFQLKWTVGDWIDLPAESDKTTIATSEYIRPADVKFDAPQLVWMTRQRVASILSGDE